MSARNIVEAVFSKPVASQILTANTLTILPLTPQDFSIGAVLPAVLYMFRWGHRRGQGRFMQEFGPGKLKPTIQYVAGKLTHENNDFVSFDSETKKNILGDLLLCYALENKAHKEGQKTEVYRVFPTHYMSSWIDLPYTIANLRFVPEMLTALLAEQPDERLLKPTVGNSRRFSVAQGFDQNILLKIFATGISVGGPMSDMAGDKVNEKVEYSVDQLLTIRMAQTCRQAPAKLHGPGNVSGIPNSWSVAQIAALNFRDDLSIFLQGYGTTVPRLTLVPMLESMMGCGLTTIFLSCLAAAIEWYRSGCLPSKEEQKPWPLFVDASNGVDHILRRLSEESMESVTGLIDQAQTALMGVRIMDAKGRFDPILSPQTPAGPDSSDWLNMLGQIRFHKHARSDAILNALNENCLALAYSLEEAGMSPELVDVLRNPSGSSDAVSRLAETISALLGDKNQRANYVKFLDGCLILDAPHGIGRKRRVALRNVTKGRSTTDMRSIVLSNTLLDALVHRHLCTDHSAGVQKPLSLSVFLKILRERYGFFVDQAPPGLSISNDDLRRNRQTLERRLRDLGLLVGVNDAESMKRLHPRYPVSQESK